MKHINAMNIAARFKAAMKQAGLSTVALSILKAQWQRAKHRADRLLRYNYRMSRYPYSSKRQLGSGGVNHPSILLPRRPRNARDFTHARWVRA